MMMKMMGASTNRFTNDDSMQLGVNRETTMLLQLIYYLNIIFLLYLCIQHRHRHRHASHDLVIGEVRVILIRHVHSVNLMTRQRNLIVVLLNGPSGHACFCFAIDIE